MRSLRTSSNVLSLPSMMLEILLWLTNLSDDKTSRINSFIKYLSKKCAHTGLSDFIYYDLLWS